jgi:hypothetical protein
MTLTVPRPRYRASPCASRCLRHDLAIRHAQVCKMSTASSVLQTDDRSIDAAEDR